ncbi:MAG: hypothetical protein JXA42_25945, partial [Anaerolineales bacterium]|nr:hypothetical protein [Anaerolineales bacterium]
YDTEFRVVWPDGSIHYLKAEAQFERAADGTPLRMTGINYDITKRKEVDEIMISYSEHLRMEVEQRTRELREAQEKLVRQEHLAALGQMAGSIGHELRNPLGVIANAVYLLKMSQPDASDEIMEYLDIIEKEMRTSDKIVTDLLDFTRIKSIDRKPTVVSDLLAITLERYHVPPPVEAIIQIPTYLPEIYADIQQIAQVIGNLITNACQAMPDGGKLTITASAQKDMIGIAVHDTGVGIPSENISKLFEPLFTTKTKGIGLGLAVSEKLVEANGGRIEVQSEPGQGSTFTIYLPIYEGDK